MSRFVLLDSGPLGLLSHPRISGDIQQWVNAQLSSGTYITIPEIVDYEVRRELLRAGKTRGVRRLDILKSTLYYAPITTQTILQAAEFWAQVRQQGRPTAHREALDADVILAAQAWVLSSAGHDVIVATDNPAHIGLFATARTWEEI
jgi:toxin FitB